MTVELPKGYKPSDDEEYMCERQLEYFRQKLENWRNELFRESARLLIELQETELQEPDLNDRASKEMEQLIDMHSRDRIRKLIDKIDAALERIKRGTFGYCLVTGEPIGLLRLNARPVATLCLEEQEKRERREREYAPKN
jgi:DnaK suppressor protein